MQKGIDKRLADLEQRIAPATKYLIYGEDPRGGGLFRRGDDPSGRLMTKDEVRADAEREGANIIFVEYRSEPVEPEPGFMAKGMAGPDIEFGEGTTAIFMPSNGRGDSDAALLFQEREE